MSLIVKVFYEHIRGSNEIRRFPVSTADDVDTFTITKEKIRQLFPALAGNFTLFWQDPDGDRVAFSSCEEMKDAMANASDGVLRVYVSEPNESSETSDQDQQHQKPSDKQPQSEDPGPSQSQGTVPNGGQGHQTHNDGPAHPGMTCNGCQGPVVGVHYKCCVCPDFDLCQACERKGLHEEHDMFKISHPHFFFPPLPRCFFDTLRRGKTPETCAGTSSSSSGPSGFRTSSTTSNSTSGFRAETHASSGSDSRPGANPNKPNNKNEKFIFEEHCDDFGTNFSAFLDPFGIKVSCSVHDGAGNSQQQNDNHGWGRRGGQCPAWEHMFRRAHQSRAPGGSQPAATEDASGKMGSDSKNTQAAWGNEARSEGVRFSDGCTTARDEDVVLRIPTSVAIPMPGPTGIPAAANHVPQPPMGATPPPRPTSIPPLTSVTPPPRPTTIPPPTGATSPPRPTTVTPPPRPTIPLQPPNSVTQPPRPAAASQPPMPSTPPRPATSPQSTTGVAPPARPTVAPQPTTSPHSPPSAEPTNTVPGINIYPNLRVQQSLDQMLGMGFSNTDGWLSQLLTVYDGNIESTIDDILSRQPSNQQDSR